MSKDYHGPISSPKTAALRALETCGPAPLGLRPLAMLVLWKLCTRLNHVERRTTVWPSWATLCADTGLSRASIARTLAELTASGLVKIERQRRGANEYTIDVEELCRRAAVPFDPDPTPQQRELGPMLGDVVKKFGRV